MQKNVIIVDDFYSNPSEVREAALLAEYSKRGGGNYPGLRSEPYINDDVKNYISDLLGQKISNWHEELSGSFQICIANERSWIHSDYSSQWAAVLYLSPDTPMGSGTSFFKHKNTGTYGCIGAGEDMVDFNGEKISEEMIPTEHYQNPHEWELTDKVASKFNRLVIFNGKMWHMSDPYFGSSMENGRLTQVFFMDGF